jgi:biopolymer transport protein ExbD
MNIKRRIHKTARIEMLPLIDIVFLLLVFFIYAMLSMAVHRGLQLDLPESTQAETVMESPLSLSIGHTPSGALDYYLNEQHVSLAELAGLLQESRNSPEPPTILVFAEENITYQQLYLVLDVLKKNGCTDISLQASSD